MPVAIEPAALSLRAAEIHNGVGDYSWVSSNCCVGFEAHSVVHIGPGAIVKSGLSPIQIQVSIHGYSKACGRAGGDERPCREHNRYAVRDIRNLSGRLVRRLDGHLVW